MSAANLRRQIEAMVGQGYVPKATATYELDMPMKFDQTVACVGVLTTTVGVVIGTTLAVGTTSTFTGVATFTAAPVFSTPPTTSVADALTAHAGGGQGSGLALTKSINRVTTAATAGDSVVLPAALAGKSITVENSAAANPIDIFPATGDAINTLAVNTAVRINANYMVEFKCSVAGTWVTSPILPKPATFVTNTTTTTFAAGQLTGGAFVVYTNTQGTPGSIQTRTAAQMFSDAGNVQIGDTYMLRVINGQGTGVLTITAGSNVTLTGTMTLAINSWRDFVVTFTDATHLVIQNAGTGTFS